MKIKKLLFVGLFVGLIACMCVGCSSFDQVKDTVKQWGCEHAYGEEMTVETEPTCIEDGEGIVTCTKCGKEKTVTVEKLGHDVVVLEEAVAPTCTTPGKTEKTGCSRCDMVETEAQGIPATGHDIVVLEEAVAPTCTTAGSTAKTGCSRCDFIQEESEEIPAGHQYGEDKICTVCGESSLPFAYTLSQDGTYYTLSGVTAKITDTDITLPAWHNGLPVKKVSTNALDYSNEFSYMPYFTNVTIPDGIEELGISVFSNQRYLKTLVFPKNMNVVNFYCLGNCGVEKVVVLSDQKMDIDFDDLYMGFQISFTLYVRSSLLAEYQEADPDHVNQYAAIEGSEFEDYLVEVTETEGSEEVSTETLTVAAKIVENTTQAAAIETDGIETDVIDELIETDITMETGVAFNNAWRV